MIAEARRPRSPRGERRDRWVEARQTPHGESGESRSACQPRQRHGRRRGLVRQPRPQLQPQHLHLYRPEPRPLRPRRLRDEEHPAHQCQPLRRQPLQLDPDQRRSPGRQPDQSEPRLLGVPRARHQRRHPLLPHPALQRRHRQQRLPNRRRPLLPGWRLPAADVPIRNVQPGTSPRASTPGTTTARRGSNARRRAWPARRLAPDRECAASQRREACAAADSVFRAGSRDADGDEYAWTSTSGAIA